MPWWLWWLCWCYIYDSKQKHKELHTSERTIVPRTVIFETGSETFSIPFFSNTFKINKRDVQLWYKTHMGKGKEHKWIIQQKLAIVKIR